MNPIDRVREALPQAAKDIKLNLQTVLGTGSLSESQRWGVALSCAIASRNQVVLEAVAQAASEAAAPEVIDDAVAAASIMAMNNVYYRFRHIVGKPSYQDMPARLRMHRLVRPASNKVDFELYCLAVSAINGCESCVRAHEQTVVQGGLTEEQVHDAIRIAATIHAAAVASSWPPPVSTTAAMPQAAT